MSEQVDAALADDDERSTRSSIGWRQLDARLWAGRSDGRPVGTIEQGRDFVFVDLAGDRHAGYRTLDDAKDAATGIAPTVGVPRSARWARLGVVRLVTASVVVVCVLAVVWAVLKYQVLQ